MSKLGLEGIVSKRLYAAIAPSFRKVDLDQEPKRTDSDTGYRKGLLIVTTMQMNLSRRLIIGSLAVCVTSSAGAQTNLGQNKTGAQLYASVCADCHKSPQSLKPAGIFGLESFLREHYTADRQSAAAIAAYLNGLKKPLAESPRGRTAKRTNQAKPAEPSKSTANKPRPPADIPRPPADLKLQKFD